MVFTSTWQHQSENYICLSTLDITHCHAFKQMATTTGYKKLCVNSKTPHTYTRPIGQLSVPACWCDVGMTIYWLTCGRAGCEVIESRRPRFIRASCNIVKTCSCCSGFKETICWTSLCGLTALKRTMITNTHKPVRCNENEDFSTVESHTFNQCPTFESEKTTYCIAANGKG
jgi:hypothetical protein